MARGQETGNQIMVPEAKQAMDKFKYEVANELNIDTSKIQNDYWGELTSRENGAVGGHMVRKMIRMAEQEVKNSYDGPNPQQ